MNNLSRMTLGTAGLCLPDYPPGSPHPQPSPTESIALVRRAYDLGIRHFDCARGYGASEDLLATAFDLVPPVDVRITSKSAPEYYLQARKASPFRPMLLHNPTGEQLWLWWHNAAGASVNTPEQANIAIAAGYKHLQCPHWVLDQRYAKAGIFEAAKRHGVTTYARQPFGRGLLLAEPGDDLDDSIGMSGVDLIYAYHGICRRRKISYVEAALRFSLESPADQIVFGCSSIAQLEENIHVATTDPPESWPACYAELLSTFADAGLVLASVCTPEAR